MEEHRRSGVVIWLLIGLVVLLTLGTAAGAAIPALRCPACRVQRNEDGSKVRRIRIDGKWKTTADLCPCCADRKKVTALNYALTALRNERRR